MRFVDPKYSYFDKLYGLFNFQKLSFCYVGMIGCNFEITRKLKKKILCSIKI